MFTALSKSVIIVNVQPAHFLIYFYYSRVFSILLFSQLIFCFRRRGNETSNPLLALHRLEEAHQSLAEESSHSALLQNNSTHNSSSGNLGALGTIGSSTHGAGGSTSGAVSTPLVKKTPTTIFTPTTPVNTGLASGIKSSENVGTSVSGFGTSRNPNFSRIIVTASDESSTKDDVARSIEMDSNNFVVSPVHSPAPRLSPPPK